MTLREESESLAVDVMDADQKVASYKQSADTDEAMIGKVGAA